MTLSSAPRSKRAGTKAWRAIGLAGALVAVGISSAFVWHALRPGPGARSAEITLGLLVCYGSAAAVAFLLDP